MLLYIFRTICDSFHCNFNTDENFKKLSKTIVHNKCLE